jgi:signal transduction histidine kinase
VTVPPQETYRPIIAHPVRRWGVMAGFWTAFGLFMASQTHFLTAHGPSPLTWPTSLFRELVYAYLWLALTPVVLRLAARFPLRRERWAATGVLHLCFSAGVAFLHKFSYHCILTLAESPSGVPFSFAAIFPAVFSYLDYGLILYWFLVVLYLSADYYRRYRDAAVTAAELETRLARAQLQTLRMQIQPHFLFNTLNTVSVLIPDRPEIAQRMLLKLSELLRLTLEVQQDQTVPLREEVAILERYLEIEQLRFQDRLTVRLDLDPSSMAAQVPQLILQPLVENAMRHGVAKQRGPAEVVIRSRQENGSLILEVEDTGPGIGETLREGIGLANTRARMDRLYGSRYGMEFTRSSAGRFVARLSFPSARPAPLAS